MVFMTQISHNSLVFNRPLLHLFRHHSNPLPGSPVQERFVQQFQRSFTVTKPTVCSLVCGSSGEEPWLLESASKFCFFWGGKVHPESSHVNLLLKQMEKHSFSPAQNSVP